MVNMVIANDAKAFWQWDKNAVLMVSGCDEVHFCHEGDETAILVPVTFTDGACRLEHGHREKKGFVNVPVVLLESSEELICFAYGEDKTLCRFYFDVRERPMPSTYVPESEIPKWEELEEALQKKLDKPPLTGSGGEYLVNDGSGGTLWVPLDTELDPESDNAVTNGAAARGIRDAEERVTDIVNATADDLAALATEFHGHSHPVDDVLSDTSENPVENRVITAALAGKAAAEHSHGLNDLDGVLDITHGGTGGSTAEQARANIGAAAANHTHPVDDALSTESANPVENRVITAALNGKAAADHRHPVDDALSAVSVNPVENRVIKTALDGKSDTSHFHTVDMTLSATSTNPVENQAVYAALAGKSDRSHTHPIDGALDDASVNPVENRVITAALAGKSDVDHTHAAGDIASGTLAAARLPVVPVTKGGTGATTKAAALTSLGAAAADHSHTTVNGHTVESDVPAGAKFTDTVYTHPTTAGNKHIPSGGSSGQILRWSADGTAAWGADNNTTYSAGTGLSLSGTTINHANAVTAGTAGTSSATSGSTLTVPWVTYDAQGHVTASGTHTHTVSGFAASSHTHAAGDITSGTLAAARLPVVPVTKGGTGATTKAAALTNLGAAAAEHSHSDYATLTDVTEKIDEIEIGGRNYAVTSTGNVSIGTTATRASGVTATLTGPSTLRLSGTASTIDWFFSSSKVFGGIEFDVGTYAVWCSSDNVVLRVGYGADATYLRPMEGTKSSPYIWINQTKQIYWFTPYAKIGSSFTDEEIHIVVERGNKATDWTPAPEDKADVDHSHTTVNGHTVESDVPAGAVFTDTVYTHPSYTARTGKPTANQTPGFGATFTLSQITSDASGHVTGATDRTVKIPDTAATQSAAGLMSAADKTKLDGIASGAQVNTVTGVKGDAESSYRVGNVNLTAANVGALPLADGQAMRADIDTLIPYAVGLPKVGFNEVGDPSHTNSIYFEKWLQYMVRNHPSKMFADKVVVAPVTPNSSGTVIGYCYTNAPDSNDIPRYCTFLYLPLNGRPYYFGTSDYTYFFNTVNTDTVYTHPTTAGNKHIPSGGSSGQILRWSADGTAAWGADNNTTYTAATAAPGNVASTGSAGTSANYARQDHTHGISLATGDNNGQVKIAGTNVAVKGLGTAAYTASTAYAASNHTHDYAASGHTHAVGGCFARYGSLTEGTDTAYSAGNTVPIQSALVNINGFSKVSNQINCAVEGWYHIHMNFTITPSGTSGNCFLAIYKNSTVVARGACQNNASRHNVTVDWVGQLAVGDKIAPYIGTACKIADYTHNSITITKFGTV